ncbi:MAG: hypothetical protein ACM3TU_00655 [Bacillota bacterium]
MSSHDPFTSYEEAWEFIYGPEGIAPKASEWFARQFPDGHNTSLRPLVEDVLQQLPDFGPNLPRGGTDCELHPRALKLIARYGQDYKPDLEQARHFHTQELKPHPGQCFTNSWRLMRAMNKGGMGLVYVEGLAFGYLIEPMLHAWVSYGLDDEMAVDWSQYPGCPWNRYLGIAITEEEHAMLQAIAFPDTPERPLALLDIEHFPLIEEPLAKLLADRERPA